MAKDPATTPPTTLNIGIALGAVAVYLATLWGASHLESWLLRAACIGSFMLVGNTLFCLLHEAVHGIFSHNRAINEVFGQLVAMCFPTGLRFQRTCHFGHHLNNRTDHEIFDMYYPSDNRFIKNFQFYCILTGPYWLSVSMGWLLYLFAPWTFRLFTMPLFKKEQSTDAAMFIPFLNHPAKHRIRLELLLTILFQVALWNVLGLHFWPTLACFWAFGVMWGSLQYADHAWTPRDIQKGAWNLKVSTPIQWIFLNYHSHQVHHIHPQLPWIYLPGKIPQDPPNPPLWKFIRKCGRGPSPSTVPHLRPWQRLSGHSWPNFDLLS